jgi:hypothetical protein
MSRELLYDILSTLKLVILTMLILKADREGAIG